MSSSLAAGGDLLGLLSRCDFPPPGNLVTCAVSGGPDSVGLLALVLRAGCEAVVVHVDHGLRPGSAADGEVVGEVVAKLAAMGGRVELRIVKVEVGPGPNLEARARSARLAALPSGACTGHTMDDQVETVLIRLIRGASLDGLAAMRRGPRHPILGLRRSEMRLVCRELDLPTVTDPSNSDTRFVRNRVRHELIPLLCDIAGRDVVPVIARQAGIMAEESGFLEGLAEDVDPTDVHVLTSSDPVLARRAVRRWLRQGEEGYPPDYSGVERVLAVAGGFAGATDVAPGVHVRRSRGKLYKGAAGGAGGRCAPG